MSSRTRSHVIALVRRAPWLAYAIVCLRGLALISVFQLSGAAHLAGDAFEYALTGEHDDHDDDEREQEDGHECPPGCPTCHHVHALNASLPPAIAVDLSWTPMTDGVVVEWSVADDAPPNVPPSPLFRPPRA